MLVYGNDGIMEREEKTEKFTQLTAHKVWTPVETPLKTRLL